jgi:ribosome-associated protein
MRIYDVREASNVTDFFLIASAYNQRHIKALCDELHTHLKQNGIIPIGKEGIGEGGWALIDCGDFVIHIFDPDSRQFYDLELIWGDVPQVEWEGDGS